jgi:hygromycin-B 7''-O-kinase
VSLHDYVSRIDDVGFWRPYVAEIMERLDPTLAEREPAAGYNATWPTFLYGEFVVKLFGFHAAWRAAFTAERGALTLVAHDSEIAAPGLVGEGRLFDGDAWPYLVTTRVPGAASWPRVPSTDEWPSIAADLGMQVRRVHALDPSGVATEAAWPDTDVVAAAERSSLPSHLVAQVEGYLARLGPFDNVFVHGDLCAQHVFVGDGHLTGIIDWGDAMVTDRHYELIQVFRDTLNCDRALFRVFLDASDWPVGPDFPRQALGQALRRQALMLVQHPQGGDVFMPIAEKFPLQDIATLDDLATELFAV